MSESPPAALPPAGQPAVIYALPASRVGVIKIAGAVFLGNLLCALLSVVLYACLMVGGALLFAGAAQR